MKAIALHILLCIVLAMVAVGCRHTSARHAEALAAADLLMDAKPDSALSILKGVSVESLHGEERPWYALLYNKALLKNHQCDTTDTLINLAVDYFNGRGDSLDYQSLYYQGVIFHGINLPEKSLVSLYEAYEKSSIAGDLFYQAMSARELSKVYSGLDNLSKEIEWAKIAKESFLNSGKKRHAVWMDINLANAFIYDHKPFEALRLIGQVDSLLLIEDRLFKSKILICKATAQYMAERYSDAEETFIHLMSEGVDLGANNKLRYASTLMKLGRYEEAVRWIWDAETNRMYSSDSLFRLFLLAEYYEHNNNLVEAYTYRTEYSRKLGQTDETKLISSPTDLLTDTYRLRSENQRLKIEHDKLQLFLVSGICALLLFIIIGGWYLLSRRLIRQKFFAEQLIEEVTSLRGDLEFSNRAIGESKEQNQLIRKGMQMLFARHIDLLNDMSTSWYSSRDSGEGKILRANLSQSLARFQDEEIIEDMVRVIDRYDDRWMTNFREAYPNLSLGELRLAIYLYLNFRSESILLLLEKKNLQGVYFAKNRLKKKLTQSESFDLLNVAAKLHMGATNS